MDAVLEARGLTKRYGTLTAVDGLTFALPRSGVIGFVGPNGAGKTTTIRMLMGLIRPTGGEASVLGASVRRPQDYLPRVGALIESPAFYPQLSGRRNLRALAMLGGQDLARVETLLAQVGLAQRGDDAYGSYSLGMKQRLGIAAALLPDPELLILDEPTNGLDPAGIREIRTLLRSLGDAGKTVFVSSHLLAEIQRMCDRLLILRTGKIIFDGTVEALLARQVGLVAACDDAARTRDLIALCEAAGYAAEPQGDAVLVRAPKTWAGTLNASAMQAGIVLRELRPQAGDLEETVLTMTGQGGL
ncbi:MAG: type transport system ATP-binding protein [Thermoplasmata archaeon]|nr:type transport system ATP-binding protein [Thermoplasmata archaeon]